ncbi:MAG: electron transfer flavoprotein subunit alpha/FixB family protein [Gemmatimonadetes bacterium]|nr:MAG: electron transfer flavoprotein subunit alpha/FixB family protein [Gemmatimonadota bacterium]
MGNVLVYAEQQNHEFKKWAFEAVAEGKRVADQLGRECVAVVIGNGVSDMAATLGQYGAAKVLVADDPQLAEYAAEPYTQIIVDAVQQTGADIVFLSASVQGRDVAPRVGIKLDAGVATDCTEFKVEGGNLLIRRPMYAGKINATIEITSAIKVATLRPNNFLPGEPDTSASPVLEHLTVPAGDVPVKVRETHVSGGGHVELTEADIIVSGGRGLGAAENYKLIEELAAQLHAAAGASRAIVDAGWVSHDHQVGQTGKTVSPQLYIAIGISGAIQHLAGMSSSKCIVAINKDADAPIFKVANYGIVGDLFEVVPQLKAELAAAGYTG